MPVVGEPMGIEATEKPLVGTPGGDPRLCAHFSHRIFSTLHPGFPPALAAFPFAIGRVIQVEQSRSYRSVSCKFLPLALPSARRRTLPSNILESCHL